MHKFQKRLLYIFRMESSIEKILTVGELTAAVKKHLESRFPAVSVKGEVSNFKQQASGHLYFTLKDAEAQISAVLFRGNAGGLSRLPKDGDQVVAKGELSVYPPRGNYQLIIRELQFAGLGALLLKLHELKQKLEARGWFDKARKRPLPRMPKTIGVVTSPTGAVILDILKVLDRRFSGVHVILYPVKVQGEGAAQEIAQAIEQFNRYGLADVLIVGRGGGSLEDLWAFNEEIVAAAIFHSKIPVVSAVGHETDTTIADFVADVRAPTPSAAAEIVTAEKERHLQYLSQKQDHLRAVMQHLIRSARHRLEGIARHPLLSSPYAVLGQASQRVDDYSERIDLAFGQLMQRKKLQVQGLQRQLAAFDPKARVEIFRHRLRQLSAHLQAVDPKNVLRKGYSILFHEKDRSVIFSAKDLKSGDGIEVLMHDGAVKGRVT